MSFHPESSCRFTATGQPMPASKSSAWTNSCPWGEQAPNHPPFRFTDQSLIPVVVHVVPSHVFENRYGMRKKSVGGFIRKFQKSQKKTSDIKVIRMPRKEYLRYFVRDQNNNYVGTEPERTWTEQGLEAEFGMYQDLPPPLWSLVESDGTVFMEENHVWSEKEDFRSSADIL